MTTKLKLSREVDLEIDALMQPIALLGNRGSGKTYAGQSLLELAHDAGVQCIAVDVIGKWWAVRLGADGKSKGLADVYIFGGKRGDFPLTPDRGAFVAKVIVQNRIHAVLDLSLMRKGDRRRFLVDFAEEFFLLKKQEDQAAPSVLFLEEAHAVLPQKCQAEEARMLGAFEDLVREGRNFGIGVVIMDQRPATVNKNALALIEILIALRTTYKSDRDVYEDWIVQKGVDSGVKLGDVLPFLKAGQGYIYAPFYDLFSQLTITQKRTFDASATAKIGQTARAVGTLTPVDVERVREAMAEVTTAAENNDPRKLLQRALAAEKKVAALESRPSVAARGTTVPKQPKKVPVVTEVVMRRLASAGDKLQESIAQLAKVASKLSQDISSAKHFTEERSIASAVSAFKVAVARPNPDLAIHMLKATNPPRFVPSRSAAHADGDFRPCTGELKMLVVLASRAPTALTRSQLRTLSGFTDGTFRTYAPRLQRNGLIEVHGDSYSITSLGNTFVANDVAIAQTPEEVLAMWKKNLSTGEGRCLDIFQGMYPSGKTQVDLQELTGFTAGTLRTYLPRLERLGLIEKTQGAYYLSEDLVA